MDADLKEEIQKYRAKLSNLEKECSLLDFGHSTRLSAMDAKIEKLNLEIQGIPSTFEEREFQIRSEHARQLASLREHLEHLLEEEEQLAVKQAELESTTVLSDEEMEDEREELRTELFRLRGEIQEVSLANETEVLVMDERLNKETEEFRDQMAGFDEELRAKEQELVLQETRHQEQVQILREKGKNAWRMAEEADSKSAVEKKMLEAEVKSVQDQLDSLLGQEIRIRATLNTRDKAILHQLRTSNQHLEEELEVLKQRSAGNPQTRQLKDELLQKSCLLAEENRKLRKYLDSLRSRLDNSELTDLCPGPSVAAKDLLEVERLQTNIKLRKKMREDEISELQAELEALQIECQKEQKQVATEKEEGERQITLVREDMLVEKRRQLVGGRFQQPLPADGDKMMAKGKKAWPPPPPPLPNALSTTSDDAPVSLDDWLEISRRLGQIQERRQSFCKSDY